MSLETRLNEAKTHCENILKERDHLRIFNADLVKERGRARLEALDLFARVVELEFVVISSAIFAVDPARAIVDRGRYRVS